MNVKVIPMGSVWFGKKSIAIMPCGRNPALKYFTLAQIRKVALVLGYHHLASRSEVETFSKEMLRMERRRKNAPMARLLCLKHRSKIRHLKSSWSGSRNEDMRVPALSVNPHPWNASPGVALSASQHFHWGEHPIEKIAGKIYISQYEYVIFSK